MVVTLCRVRPRAQGSSHRSLMRAPGGLRGRGNGQPAAADGGREAAEGEDVPDRRGVQVERRSDRRCRRVQGFRLRRLPHPLRRPLDRHGRAEPRHAQARLSRSDRTGDERRRRDAAVQGPAQRPEDRRCRRLRRQVDRRHRPVELPETFPEHVAAFAVDLDRTLIGRDTILRPRTRAAIAATRAAGVHVIVVTGRMFRSVLRYIQAAEIDDPVICYQGALVADPVTREVLRHVPIPRDRALEAIDAVIDAGFHINAYVDDELYVAAATPEAHADADLNRVEMHVVGDLRAWLHSDPTKLVAVGDPDALDGLETELKPRFAGRLFVSKSLPHFLEFAHPDVSKGSGLQFVADRLGFTAAQTVACGAGEHDRELLGWAGFGGAVANPNRG